MARKGRLKKLWARGAAWRRKRRLAKIHSLDHRLHTSDVEYYSQLSPENRELLTEVRSKQYNPLELSYVSKDQQKNLMNELGNEEGKMHAYHIKEALKGHYIVDDRHP